MTSLRVSLALLSLVLCKSAAATPPHVLPPRPKIPTAQVLYQKYLDADDHFAYQGRQITTYWRNGHAVAALVSHQPPSAQRIDYRAPDSQQGRALLTSGAQEWEFDPHSRLTIHRRLPPNADAVADAAVSYSLLRANYGLMILPQTREQADRKVFVLSIVRKDHTLARKLWLDAATGVALKRENYREDGRVAITVAFSNITFHPKFAPGLFDPQPLTKHIGTRLVEDTSPVETPVPLNGVSGQLGGIAQVKGRLAGYQLVSAALGETNRKPLLHLRYSDGLNLISLFEQPRRQTKRPTRVPRSMRQTRIGQTVAHVTHRDSVTALNWDSGAVNLTMMGEVAERTLTSLALSLTQPAPPLTARRR